MSTRGVTAYLLAGMVAITIDELGAVHLVPIVDFVGQFPVAAGRAVRDSNGGVILPNGTRIPIARRRFTSQDIPAMALLSEGDERRFLRCLRVMVGGDRYQLRTCQALMLVGNCNLNLAIDLRSDGEYTEVGVRHGDVTVVLNQTETASPSGVPIHLSLACGSQACA